MEKSGITIETWSETLGKSRKMVCTGIEGSAEAASVSVGLVLVDLYLGSDVGPL